MPWQGLSGASKNEKYNLIKQKKLNTTIEELCENQPEEFNEYMSYCRALDFTADPDYNYLRNLFEDCMRRHSF